MAQMLDNATIARESVEAFNRGDWDAFGRIVSDDSVYDEMATQRHFEGREAILDLNRQWKTAFPDATGTIENAVEAGDTVTLEITWRGHQEGPLSTPSGELAPTGREVDIKAAQVIRVADGQIVSSHHYFDMAGMLQQLGLN